ncbi:hypothetical protein Goklo_021034 [Gossypium klotzschianum]|uniref:DUF4283 domain-containing protein n=1 Tax=Gossypium klotzschianum TaxID=34286 RepID=A0A7J8UTU4_9ROSI|nr:hypothetical protein [Gossypium klotzschianum]
MGQGVALEMEEDQSCVGESRIFGVLNEINRKENKEESWAFNGINRSRISRKLNVGIEEAAREEGKVALSNKSENIKKGFGKIRGKGVIVANGPNPNNNVLKPSNNLGASSSRPFTNRFEDGSRMRPIIVDKDLDPIHFQAVGSILNNRKNMVVKILGILRVSFVVEEQSRPRHFILNHKIGENFGQRLIDKIGEKYCENMDQELVTLSDDVSLTIPIALAFDIIIQGLSQEIGNVTSMSEVKVGVHEVKDVSLVRLFFWSCQGCGHPCFHSFMKEHKRELYVDFFTLFETRISGGNADSVIVKMGFDNSFKVEAFEFAGGFWLLWNDDVDVEVLKAHLDQWWPKIVEIITEERGITTLKLENCDTPNRLGIKTTYSGITIPTCQAASHFKIVDNITIPNPGYRDITVVRQQKMMPGVVFV